jgi:hypothetical protein
MTSKEFVKEKFPKAYADKQYDREWGGKTFYFLIWSCRDRETKIRLGEGDTESKAWVNAKQDVIYFEL